MNVPFFIAKKLIKGKKDGENFSSPVLKIAGLGIALGLAVMLLSVSIVIGFKTEINNKVTGFSAHYVISNFDSNTSFQTTPIQNNYDFLNQLRQNDRIKHIQSYAIKAGIIQTKDNIEGVVLKGIDTDYDWSFFKENLIEGELFNVTDSQKTNNVLVSKLIANRLGLKVGDKLRMYFIQEPPRMRSFIISGIYNTGLEDFDKLYIPVDIKHVRKLAGWEDNQVSGLEVYLDDFDLIEEMEMFIWRTVGYDIKQDGANLKVKSVKEIYPQIFDWLKLQDMNVIIIITMMLLVSGINMISGIIILILERITTIGVLKSVGASNKLIRKIFMFQGAYLTIKGMFWGNVVALLIGGFQYYTGFFALDPETYYVDHIPVAFSLSNFLLVNLGTLVVVFFMIMLPTIIISAIKPAKIVNYN